MTYESGVGEHLAMEQVSAFVDGETSAQESEAVERHLASCHACALRVLAATRMKAATARAAQRFVAPSDALARLSAQLQQNTEKKPARMYSFPAMRWAALAACLLLAFSVFGWRQVHEANRFAAELLDQHLAVLSADAAPEVISTDRHTVKPWFQGKLPFSFNLPEELPADTVLKGGDLTYLDGKAAALLLFSVHKHQVSVFLTKRDDSVALGAAASTRSGFLIRSATSQELRITGVSDVNSSELDALVRALARAQ